MDKQTPEAGAFVHRHLSQLKIVSRLLELELDGSEGREVSLDREVVESLLDTVEIFIEDLESDSGAAPRTREGGKAQGEKPSVTRLN